MMLHLKSLMLLPCFFSDSLAWGPVFEPLKGRSGAKVYLQISSDDEFDRPRRVEISYTVGPLNRYQVFDGEVVQSRLFISKPIVLDSSFFGIANPFDYAIN